MTQDNSNHAAHTPGSWGYGKLGNNADQWGVYDKSGRTISLSYHGEANARLIAASPELLEALENITKVAENMRDIMEAELSKPREIPNGHFNQAWAAIAKAKGG